MLVKPKVTLIYHWGSEELVSAMADVLYRGYAFEEAMKRVSSDPKIVDRRIKRFLDDGHYSVFEFMGASWLVEGSRAFTHELVRHRIASYWQESQRYVDYSKGNLRYVVPEGFLSQTDFFEAITKSYLNARKELSPEDARYLLPNAMGSRIWVQMNAREFFINFLPLRTGLGAFHEIRLAAWMMFESVIEIFPRTSEWVLKNLTKLHPDYCRNADELKQHYRTEDCRIISITDAFNKWGLQVPEKIKNKLTVSNG